MKRPRLSNLIPALQHSASRLGFLNWLALALLAVGLLVSIFH